MNQTVKSVKCSFGLFRNEVPGNGVKIYFSIDFLIYIWIMFNFNSIVIVKSWA